MARLPCRVMRHLHVHNEKAQGAEREHRAHVHDQAPSLHGGWASPTRHWLASLSNGNANAQQ
eukprot:scaffold69931_cov24-Tisochrysis_lutea.AAC.3